MSAGEIHVPMPGLPETTARVAFLDPIQRKVKEVSRLDAVLKQYGRLEKGMAALNRLGGVVTEHGAMRQATTALLRGKFVPALAAAAVVQVTISYLATAIRVGQDIPDVAKFGKSISGFGIEALGFLGALAPGQKAAPNVEAVAIRKAATVHATAALAQAAAREVGASVAYLHARNRLAVIDKALGVIGKLPLRSGSTAGLERGGVELLRGFGATGRAELGRGAGPTDVAIGFGPGPSFFSPQSVIVEEAQTLAEALAAARSAVENATRQENPAASASADEAFMARVERAVVRMELNVARGVLERAEKGRAGAEAELRILVNGPEPLPEMIAAPKGFGIVLEEMLQDSTWEDALKSSRSAIGSLEGAVRQGFKVAGAAMERWGQGIGKKIPHAVMPAVEATNALNGAIQQDLALISQINGESIGGTIAGARVQMAIVGIMAGVLGAIAIAKGVSEIISDPVAAAGHFAAAALYGIAGTLAGVALTGALDPAAARRDAEDDVNAGRAIPMGRTAADLHVFMPGYSDPRAIADALAQAINSDVSGERRYAVGEFAVARGPTGAALANALGRQYLRLQAEGATENALNTVPGPVPLLGTVIRYVGDYVQAVGDVFDDAWDAVEDWF